MDNPHRLTALEVYGNDSRESMANAKIINYASMYGMGQIKLGKIAGQYPVFRSSK